MHKPIDVEDLALKRIQRLENQMTAVIYLTKAVISFVKRMSAGENIPIEQIESIEKALDSLNPKNRR